MSPRPLPLLVEMELAAAPAHLQRLHVVPGTRLLVERLTPAAGRRQPLCINLNARGRPLFPLRMHSIWRLILGRVSMRMRLILACLPPVWGCWSLFLHRRRKH